jgi:hypothetical protein
MLNIIFSGLVSIISIKVPTIFNSLLMQFHAVQSLGLALKQSSCKMVTISSLKHAS